MNGNWPNVALGEVVEHRKKFIQIDDASEYKRCRVQLHTKGIVLRDTIQGAAIKTKKQQVCRAGEFLVAEIDAKVGGFGIVPEELEEAIVSSHYFLFAVDEALLDKRFLGYFVKTPAFREQVSAQGSTNYAAIRPSHVLDYTIPLPPLSEQRRIVAKIDQLAQRIDEAKQLRGRSDHEIIVVGDAVAKSVFQSLYETYGFKPLGEIIETANYGTSMKCHSDREPDAVPVLRIPNVASERIALSDMKYAALGDKERRMATAKTGDLLVVRTNGSPDLVGRCAVVPELPEPHSFASYLIRLRCDTTRVEPMYLQRALRFLRATGKLFDFARTTAGQYNVSLGRLRAAEIPIPPLLEQHRIVAYLDNLQAKVDALKEQQAKSSAELDALLPSILDRAFQGEL